MRGDVIAFDATTVDDDLHHAFHNYNLRHALFKEYWFQVEAFSIFITVLVARMQ